MSTTYPTKTYQDPQIDPQDASDQVSYYKQQFETELNRFEAMAYGWVNTVGQHHADPGMALMYFMMVVFGSFLDYQGSEMNMYSAQMDVLSILNTDLSNMQSDFNNIIEELQSQVSSGGTASLSSTDPNLEKFINDSAQYAVDIGHWFDSGDIFGGPNGAASSLLKNIRAEVDTFYSEPGGGNDNFFWDASKHQGDLAEVQAALTQSQNGGEHNYNQSSQWQQEAIQEIQNINNVNNSETR